MVWFLSLQSKQPEPWTHANCCTCVILRGYPCGGLKASSEGKPSWTPICTGWVVLSGAVSCFFSESKWELTSSQTCEGYRQMPVRGWYLCSQLKQPPHPVICCLDYFQTSSRHNFSQPLDAMGTCSMKVGQRRVTNVQGDTKQGSVLCVACMKTYIYVF